MGNILYSGAIHIREQAKIDAARIRQKGSNERQAAESELARFSAALSNKKALDAAGKSIGASAENIGRNLEAATFGNFMGRVAAAEELGTAAAMNAAAGVGGSSVEAYNETVRLSQALAREKSDRAVNSDLIGASNQRGDIMIDAVGSMDNNAYRANMDYTQYVDHNKPSFLGNMMTLGMAAAATYFGGPQAGQAVLSLREANIAASNGDFDTATQSVMGALKMGTSAFRDTRAMGGDYWQSVREKNAQTRIPDGIRFGGASGLVDPRKQGYPYNPNWNY